MNGASVGKISDEITIAEVCYHLGWTYQEFESQPLWFVAMMTTRIREEAKANSRSVSNKFRK